MEEREMSEPEVFERKVRQHYRELTKLLIEKQLSITTMESATGGQIASLLTDTEGASAVIKGAFVTYSNEAKILQGVPAEIIEKYTVYSIETAEAMAKACRKAYQADIGIGVTGTMGNVDPANQAASVPGQVYFAISTDRETKGYETQIVIQDVMQYALQNTLQNALQKETPVSTQKEFLLSRLSYKLAVAEKIYEVLYKILTQTDSKTTI